MIIIKTIILYFIQITHTDDFPSTGGASEYNTPSTRSAEFFLSTSPLVRSLVKIAAD